MHARARFRTRILDQFMDPSIMQQESDYVFVENDSLRVLTW